MMILIIIKNITDTTKSTTKEALDVADRNVQEGIRLSNQSEKAIAQLDQVAQQNAQGAQITAKTSEDLQLLSKELEEQIQLLNKIVGVRS